MSLLDKLTNPVWQKISKLGIDHRRIAALIVVGYGFCRASVADGLVYPLEMSGLLPTSGKIESSLRELLIDEAIVGLLKSCSVPENDGSGMLPDKIIPILPEVWGALVLADRNHRTKEPGPAVLDQSHYSRDRDEARTQVLVKWMELLGISEADFVTSANTKWFHEYWESFSDGFIAGCITSWSRNRDELYLKKAQGITRSIPASHVPILLFMVEKISEVPIRP